MSRDVLIGLDVVWIASDRDGYLAAFVTGGEGDIPPSAFKPELLALASVEEAICLLAVTSQAQLKVSIPRPNSFIEMAQRGFYVYDWRDIHRSAVNCTHAYELVAVPLNPLHKSELSTSLARCAAEIMFKQIAFSQEIRLEISTVK